MDLAALREAAEEPWRDAALKSEGPVLALVGRLIPIKNVPMFLRTVRALVPRYPTIEGWVIGDGPLRTELASRAAEMGLTGHLRFWGEAANVPRLLARADLFCHCSWSEGLSNAIMEAAALALPVVATRAGGAAELVEDEGSGFLVAPDDHVAMADRVSRLIDDPGLHARVGEAGRQKMESEFSLDRMVNDMLAVYGELLTREGLPAMQRFPC
jgi:glycosyltransferase involved in cell wall biosynthesis